MLMRLRLAHFVALILAFGRVEIVAPAASPAPGIERFYVGTYAGAIYQSSLNLGTTGFGAISVAATTGDPSFVAMTPNRRFLYAVNEGAGLVVAFFVNPTNGVLTQFNQ